MDLVGLWLSKLCCSADWQRVRVPHKGCEHKNTSGSEVRREESYNCSININNDIIVWLTFLTVTVLRLFTLNDDTDLLLIRWDAAKQQRCNAVFSRNVEEVLCESVKHQEQLKNTQTTAAVCLARFRSVSSPAIHSSPQQTRRASGAQGSSSAQDRKSGTETQYSIRFIFKIK